MRKKLFAARNGGAADSDEGNQYSGLVVISIPGWRDQSSERSDAGFCILLKVIAIVKLVVVVAVGKWKSLLRFPRAVCAVVMPILGAGHGGIAPPLAFVGLLLALAEAARYGQGGQHLKRATIVVFKLSANTPGEVDGVVVRRALALIGSRG